MRSLIEELGYIIAAILVAAIMLAWVLFGLVIPSFQTYVDAEIPKDTAGAFIEKVDRADPVLTVPESINFTTEQIYIDFRTYLADKSIKAVNADNVDISENITIKPADANTVQFYDEASMSFGGRNLVPGAYRFLVSVIDYTPEKYYGNSSNVYLTVIVSEVPIVMTTGLIEDSWEEIISHINDGTYSQRYAVGAYKPLDLGSEGVINMQVAAINTDVLSDGTGNAHITWIAKELLATKHNMNTERTNTNGWVASEMRTYLQDDIWSLINPVIQNSIVAVDKTYGSTLTCSDKIWIPSYREVGFGTDQENSGVIYFELFTDDASRIKALNGTNSPWWLRSEYSNSNDSFRVVNHAGSKYNVYADVMYGVVLGFCF